MPKLSKRKQHSRKVGFQSHHASQVVPVHAVAIVASSAVRTVASPPSDEQRATPAAAPATPAASVAHSTDGEMEGKRHRSMMDALFDVSDVAPMAASDDENVADMGDCSLVELIDICSDDDNGG
jgi:hypothetical protein